MIRLVIRFGRRALLLLGLAAPAFAQAPAPAFSLSESDRGRMERIDATRAKALEKAQSAAPAMLRIVHDVVGAPAQPIDLKSLPGNWRCRSLKLGGEFAPVSVDPFFACRIRTFDNGLMFEKTTGSIRRQARLVVTDEHQMLYYG